MRRLLLALAMASLWADHARAQKGPRPEDVTLSMLLGGTVSLATQATPAVSPWAAVAVSLPVSGWRLTPRLHVRLEFIGLPGDPAAEGASTLPGESAVLEDLRTYRSIEVSMAVCQPIADALYVDVCLAGGFNTRLPGEVDPRDRAVRWGQVHLRFGRVGKGWLEVGAGRDQRLDGLYRWAAEAAGGIELHEMKKPKGSVQLVGKAILGLELGGRAKPARRDVVIVGLAIGR